jgi:16S rRNA (adenine1518-N6/adenine1519-N6)-dimethyltransferase
VTRLRTHRPRETASAEPGGSHAAAHAGHRRARKRFGQHFLVPVWADKVIAAIAPRSGETFLEIGPGPGVLTARLAARVARVTAVEIDRELAAALPASVPPNVEVVTADVLDVDLASILPPGPVRIAGNLPYNISSPILFKLLAFAGTTGSAQDLSGLPQPIDATLMLQREVADRLVAPVGTKDYGVLTILTAARADVTRLLALPPGAFRPAPKVHSAIVRLTFVPPRVPAELERTFERLVRTIFMQRRKVVGNALRPFAEALQLDPATALSEAGIDARRRPETLDLAALLRLAAAFEASAPKA